MVSTLAGTPGTSGYIDGVGTSAKFCYPRGIFFSEKDQSLYVSDFSNNKLRRIAANGTFFLLLCFPFIHLLIFPS
jgi:hypothetical protein